MVDAPEQILAITFTRKAAAEMRERVLAGAARGGAGPVPRQQLETPYARAALAQAARRGWALLEIPRGFASRPSMRSITCWPRALPVAARGGAALEIALPATPLYRARRARRRLRAALADPASAAAAGSLFARLDNSWQRLEQLLAEMLARRSHWLPRVLAAPIGSCSSAWPQSVRSIISAQLARVRHAMPERRCVKPLRCCATPTAIRRARGRLAAPQAPRRICHSGECCASWR